jgi:hypothetical protein
MGLPAAEKEVVYPHLKSLLAPGLSDYLQGCHEGSWLYRRFPNYRNSHHHSALGGRSPLEISQFCDRFAFGLLQ